MAEGVLEITDAEFEDTVLNAGKPALVDFWAPWCGPCRMLGPTIEELAKEYAEKAVVAKVNVEDNQDTASKFGIMSIPAVFIFKDGQVAENFVGVQTKDTYAEALDKHLEG